MANDLYEEWIEIPRIHYRQMLLDLIMTISKLLNKVNKNEDALDYLEYGIRKEPFREDFYLLSLQILNEENRVWEQAFLYKKYKEIVENELGIMPSQEIEREYNRLKEANVLMIDNSENQFEIDIDNELESIRNETETSGAMGCDFNTFREVYKLKKRYTARTGDPCTLLRICFDEIFDAKKLEEYVVEIEKGLRGVDVVSRHNNNIVILLHGAPLEANLIISQRILGFTPLREIGANPKMNWEEISTPVKKEEKELSIDPNPLFSDKKE